MTTPATGSASAQRRSDHSVLRVPAVVMMSGQQVFEVRTLDIAPRGMDIVAPANPRPGTTFTIKCTIPVRPKGRTTIEVQAKVVQSVFCSTENGFKIGLTFVDTPPTTASAILQYLNG